MKNFIMIFIAAFALAGCKKDKEQGNNDTRYGVPADAVVKYNDAIPQLDIDGDGVSDAAFAVYLYMNDGWAVEHFYIYPEDNTDIAVQNENDALAYERGKVINEAAVKDGKWLNNRAVLFEKRTKNGETVLTGNWKHAQNKYLGIRITKGGKYYYGWIKMSQHNNAEGDAQMTLTRVAIKTKAGSGIKTVE